jgi:hypothetical protein
MVGDELTPQDHALCVLQHLNRHAARAQEVFLPDEAVILTYNHPRNSVQESRPTALGAGREGGIQSALAPSGTCLIPPVMRVTAL